MARSKSSSTHSAESLGGLLDFAVFRGDLDVDAIRARLDLFLELGFCTAVLGGDPLWLGFGASLRVTTAMRGDSHRVVAGKCSGFGFRELQHVMPAGIGAAIGWASGCWKELDAGIGERSAIELDGARDLPQFRPFVPAARKKRCRQCRDDKQSPRHVQTPFRATVRFNRERPPALVLK